MTTQHTWVWIGSGVLAVAAALALGVPLGSVLIVAAILACPLAMYFGMRGMGMGHESRHERINRATHPPDEVRRMEDQERHTAPRK
jgi:uncharacterized membrane protein YdjX (TVP38/TMEM64 family)